MRVKVLASGSTGNCTYIETQCHRILVDVGISKKAIDEELLNIGIKPESIEAIFITHEHDDHIRSLPTILKKQNLLCYMTAGTYEALLKSHSQNLRDILAKRYAEGYIILLNRLADSILYQDVFLEDLTVTVLPTFHDAIEPVGYKFSADGQNVVYITDTGYIHRQLYPLISNADCYILECNHDPHILMASNRTYNLKMRILSDHGHLSNEDAFVTLGKILGEQTKLVFCAHISQECNLREIIEMTRARVFEALGIACESVDFIITSPRSTEVYEI